MWSFSGLPDSIMASFATKMTFILSIELRLTNMLQSYVISRSKT